MLASAPSLLSADVDSTIPRKLGGYDIEPKPRYSIRIGVLASELGFLCPHTPKKLTSAPNLLSISVNSTIPHKL